MRGEKLCEICLDYYKKKYGLKRNEELLNHEEFNQLVKAYEQETED